MKLKTIKLYQFSEAPEELQEKIINNYYDINIDFDWWDSLYFDANEIGLKITSFDLDRNKHAKGKFTESPEDVAANILKNHGEATGTYKLANDFLSDLKKIKDTQTEEDDKEREIEELNETFLSDLLEEYANMLQKDYDYLTSREAIIETLVSNEYYFDEKGKIDRPD